MANYKELERYGIIGNLETCALVADDGSIDWLCLPHIESPSVFASILDNQKGGRFAITPVGKYTSRQNYIRDTNVLSTFFDTEAGSAELTDFMPVHRGGDENHSERHAIYRRLRCNNGAAEFEVVFSPHFNYAREAGTLALAENGIEAAWQHNMWLFFQSQVPLSVDHHSASSRFSVKRGEQLWFVLQYGKKELQSNERCAEELKRTERFWSEWANKGTLNAALRDSRWRDLVVRSGLVLKLLAHEDGGAICAAPTTSLPESIGGGRNWDYRYNWIRDASFTVQALYHLGHHDEARKHLRWFVDICRRYPDPSKIQIMYGLHGQSDLSESELVHLDGYMGSRPVRIGNGAAKQRQLDIFGELLNAIYETERYGDEIPEGELEFITKIVDYVCEVWDTPDSGIWEVRGGPRHFVYSKLMCWVALDRGIKIVQRRQYRAPTEKWETVREQIKRAILEKGYNAEIGSFVQSFGSATLDATSLLIPLRGLLPPDDPRVSKTIDVTMKKLTTPSGLVYRYNGEDGLAGKEGAFLLCSFWLVNALSLSGRITDAEALFDKLTGYAGKTGLFSEEVDPNTGKQLGNFPQAFSHVGIINSVLYLSHSRGRLTTGPTPAGAMEQ